VSQVSEGVGACQALNGDGRKRAGTGGAGVEGEKRAKGNLTMQWELVRPWVNRVGIVLQFLSFWFVGPEVLGEERLRVLELRIEHGIRVLSSYILPLATFGQWVATFVVLWDSLAELEFLISWRGIRLARLPFDGVKWWVAYSLGEGVVRAASGDREAHHRRRRRLWAALRVLSMLSAWVAMGLLAWRAWKAKDWAWVVVAALAAWVFVLESVLAIKNPSEARVWGGTAALVTGLIVVLMWGEIGSSWFVVLLTMMTMVQPWAGVQNKVLPPLLQALAEDKHIRQRSLAVGAVLFVVGFLLQLIATF
jgi:hypothetical protein